MANVIEENRYDFDLSFQEKVASLFIRDTKFAARTKDLIEPEYFSTDALSAVINIAKEHVLTYRSAPEIKLMPMLIRDAIAAKKIRADTVPEIKDLIRRIMGIKLTNPEFAIDKVSDFARHQAMERAIMASVDLLEKGDFKKIDEAMRQALNVGDQGDSEDYDYFAEIGSRTKQREDIRDGKSVRNGITSGYSAIDAHLYHAGWGRKELSCIMGPAKSGKSLSLGDFSKNASLAGYNALYVSLEVSKEIIGDRIDAAMSDTMIRKLHEKPDEVEAKIKALEGKAGKFHMRDYPSGSFKCSHLRTLLDNYRADGINFDLVAVDYADIMAPEYRNEDLRESLRQIYIDLRGIAHEYNIALLTATQTNRDGAKASTAKATDVGDDWNKARTVDILIGINATDAEKAAGEARLYWALSRNTEDGFQIRIKQDREKMKFIDKVIGREK